MVPLCHTPIMESGSTESCHYKWHVSTDLQRTHEAQVELLTYCREASRQAGNNEHSLTTAKKRRIGTGDDTNNDDSGDEDDVVVRNLNEALEEEEKNEALEEEEGGTGVYEVDNVTSDPELEGGQEAGESDSEF